MTQRAYDLVVYGATGYLGFAIASHIATRAPSTLRWAVAGRNATKLSALSDRLSGTHTHLKPPPFMVSTLEPSNLDALAAQTKMILNLAGPFCKYGTPVVEACIRQSTAYIDPSGEHTWSHGIAKQFHDLAVAQKVPIIPHCAVEASAPDLMTALLFNQMRDHDLTPVGPVRFSIEHPWPGFSGSTIAAILGVLDTFSLGQINASSEPKAYCVANAGTLSSPPLAILPVRNDAVLGPLTFNPSAMTDRAVVMRTWSLLQRYAAPGNGYGTRFGYQGYARAPSLLQGWFGFLGMSVMTLLVVLLPPLRRILSWCAPEPGTGPKTGKDEGYFVEWRAVVDAQTREETHPARVTGTMRLELDPYASAALLVVEAALSALDELSKEKPMSILGELRGGVLTPACIGPTYLSRLQQAGLRVHTDVHIAGLGKKLG